MNPTEQKDGGPAHTPEFDKPQWRWTDMKNNAQRRGPYNGGETLTVTFYRAHLDGENGTHLPPYVQLDFARRAACILTELERAAFNPQWAGEARAEKGGAS